MTGLIDIGGGLRDIYGAGVMDCFLDNGISFDMCIGVSAGSANISSFIAGQRGRNFHFYTEYALRKEYMSMDEMKKTGSYINLDYIYSTLSDSDGENPLDYDALMASETQMITVATKADTGEAVYFEKKDIIKDNLWLIKASCAIPVLCRPYEWNNEKYFDGGVADPIPVEKSFELGCNKVVVIIPRHIEERKKELTSLMKPFLKGYPKMLELLKERHIIYNNKLKLLKKYEDEGKVILLSPDSDNGLTVITRDKDKLTDFYYKAYDDCKQKLELI